MNAHSFAGYSRPQAPRAVSPIEPPHPRAVAMAEAMIEVLARDGQVTYAEIQQRGFSAAEIVEHEVEARGIVREASGKPAAPSFDRLPEIIDKAKTAIANRMPVTADIAADPASVDHPALRERWGRYCAARAAYQLHDWYPLSERCITCLADFLAMLPLLPREVNRVLTEVAGTIRRRRP